MLFSELLQEDDRYTSDQHSIIIDLNNLFRTIHSVEYRKLQGSVKQINALKSKAENAHLDLVDIKELTELVRLKIKDEGGNHSRKKLSDLMQTKDFVKKFKDIIIKTYSVDLKKQKSQLEKFNDLIKLSEKFPHCGQLNAQDFALMIELLEVSIKLISIALELESAEKEGSFYKALAAKRKELKTHRTEFVAFSEYLLKLNQTKIRNTPVAVLGESFLDCSDESPEPNDLHSLQNNFLEEVLITDAKREVKGDKADPVDLWRSLLSPPIASDVVDQSAYQKSDSIREFLESYVNEYNAQQSQECRDETSSPWLDVMITGIKSMFPLMLADNQTFKTCTEYADLLRSIIDRILVATGAASTTALLVQQDTAICGEKLSESEKVGDEGLLQNKNCSDGKSEVIEGDESEAGSSEQKDKHTINLTVHNRDFEEHTSSANEIISKQERQRCCCFSFFYNRNNSLKAEDIKGLGKAKKNVLYSLIANLSVSVNDNIRMKTLIDEIRRKNPDGEYSKIIDFHRSKHSLFAKGKTKTRADLDVFLHGFLSREAYDYYSGKSTKTPDVWVKPIPLKFHKDAVPSL